MQGNRASQFHAHFTALAGEIERRLAAHEIALTSFSAEQSDFIRFNEGKVRQTGHVSQASLTLRLIDGQRQAYATLTPAGDIVADTHAIVDTLAALREGLRDAPDDPHLLFDTTVWSESTQRAGTLPSPDALPLIVAQCARGLDFVGFYAGGTIARGFASSTGSRGWYEVENFNFSWSLYDASGRAIKSHYAGDTWSDAVFAGKLEEAAARLPILAREPRMLKPGSYRTYLAAAAMQELMETASFSAFSARTQATARNEFYRLNIGEMSLDPRVTLTEDLSLDITPRFNGDGYQRRSVQLIEAGQAVSQLTNARTAREYGLTPNGATGAEAPSALSMQGGDLAQDDVLRALDTGLYIGNLWYVNFSDRMNCRMTGMTRFATFWVEQGRIVAPVDAMRFDDSLYRLLGSELERLDAAPELLLNDWTWGERATGGMKLPGLLVRSFDLTL
ncbi:TldD/PmbA family protein [Paraburkholderia sp. Tr-20389]|uniref:TldD/PmbA family protein n=1 Tax=Paraburkholderia sp. Tr-20389 TaxID=2703903 RepID=UPI00197D6877|nr:metallopeptidase TldD-related protein [Paraburkholderia sp. Tr-20389]MBN3758106.1 TldD/PmbA family protein [Paraburkholderia sp. Tr-20389]